MLAGFGHDGAVLVFVDIRLSVNPFVDRQRVFHDPQMALRLTGHPQKGWQYGIKPHQCVCVDNKTVFRYPQMTL
jgi:hypothetical protein